MRYSKQGIDLTKQFESCRLVAFKPTPSDPWTLGWGHTLGVEEGMTCSQGQADQWLLDDVADAENAVNRLVKIGLTQEEFDALVDFTFNVGVNAFQHSTLLAKLNENDVQGAADEFEKWDMAGGQVVAGLLRRRNAERALFTLGADFSGESQPQTEVQS